MYFYFLNLDTASFQSSGLNRLTESATTTAKIANGINTSIFTPMKVKVGIEVMVLLADRQQV